MHLGYSTASTIATVTFMVIFPCWTQKATIIDDVNTKCVPFQEAFTCSDAPYNRTVLPNAFGHQSLDDVQSALNDFDPLIVTNCSKLLKQFLCFAFAPPCTVLETPIPVCRAFCEEVVTKECVDILKRHKQDPHVFRCENYPKGGLCILKNNTISDKSDVDSKEIYYPEKELYFTDMNSLDSTEDNIDLNLVLLVTNGNKIQLLDIRSPNSMDTITLYRSRSTVISTSIDYYNTTGDQSTGDQTYIYWVSNTDGKIIRGEWHYETLRNVRTVVDIGFSSVDSIAVDWNLGLLFWLESYPRPRLQAASLSGRQETTLLSDLQNPICLVQDPKHGYLFWIDRRGPLLDQTSTIECYSILDDRKWTVFNISGADPDGSRPKAIAVDIPEMTLYWVDARSESLHKVSYDGTGHVVLLRNHERLQDPGSLTVYGDHVLWTDTQSSSIIWVSKTTGKDELIVKTFDIHPPQNIKIYGNRDTISKTSYDKTKLKPIWKELTSKENFEIDEYDNDDDDDDDDYYDGRRRKKNPKNESSAEIHRPSILVYFSLLFFILLYN